MFTIEDLSLGKCAVINDGTVEELREVLKLAFPEVGCIVRGVYKFYSIDNSNSGGWYPTDCIQLPTQSVKYFLKPKLKRGDLVWVSDNDPNERKEQKIYLDYIEGTKYPFIVVEDGDEICFHNGELYDITKYAYATKVEEPKEVIMTIEEIEKALNIKNLKIVK
jgi:hypothetical protein